MTISAPTVSGAAAASRMKVGTLSYTRAGLITLFVYLLWGDFCFTLMETVVPSIMPLKFHAIGAPNWVLGLVLTTIPNLMNTVINPFISFRSDRLRSRWGRRIPFLMGATPFLVVFLTLLGYAEPIAKWIYASLLGGQGSQLTVTLVVIGAFMVCFQFFNLFVTSVYYYLFNDVVPEAFLARFMALFRMVGTAAGALFNAFVFRYAESHTGQIFLISGLLYLVAFGVMCWRVKEGEYPPPPPLQGNKQDGFLANLRTYAVECFSHKFYWFFFLANMSFAMTWVSGTYAVLTATNIIKISLETFGQVAGVCGIVSLLLLYPAGAIADRFHPLRVLLVSIILQVCIAPLSITFLFSRGMIPDSTAMGIYIGLSALSLPIGTLHAASELPMFMKLLPRERYGQFCSANALIRSIGLMVGGLACGMFLDAVKVFGATPDQCYRFVPVWNLTWLICAGIFYGLLYREWKALGGNSGTYVPPEAGKA